MKGLTQKRILCLHAITRGFAYCVFDAPGQLLDYGIKHLKRGDKNAESISLIERLITRFDPHGIVLEDVTDIHSKRTGRIRTLYRQIESLADRANLEVYAYPWPIVFKVFGEYMPKTCHDIAIQLSMILPELARRLPPKRKPWLPLDPRQAIFDAAALGQTYYAVSG